MALKDWKIDKEWHQLGRPTWTKYVRGKKYVIQVQIPSSYIWKTQGDGTKKWLVWHRGPDGIEHGRLFKTKSEALKYAKEYMSKH